MKSFFILVLFFANTSAICQTSLNPRIEVKYVNSGINTIIAIDYKRFDSAFAKSIYKDTVITDSYLFSKLWSGYKTAKYSKKYRRIDTRYKISLYSPNATNPILIYTNYDGEAVINNKLLSRCNLSKTLQRFIEDLGRKKG